MCTHLTTQGSSLPILLGGSLGKEGCEGQVSSGPLYLETFLSPGGNEPVYNCWRGVLPQNLEAGLLPLMSFHLALDLYVESRPVETCFIFFSPLV